MSWTRPAFRLSTILFSSGMIKKVDLGKERLLPRPMLVETAQCQLLIGAPVREVIGPRAHGVTTEILRPRRIN